jgi:hypothetical protein
VNAGQVKATAQTGDVLLVSGNDAEQVGIQIATCSAFCHAALLVREGGQLIVAEFLEPDGYRTISFDDWLTERAGQKIFYGVAPDTVRAGEPAMLAGLSKYTDPAARKYDFAALPLVWLSHVTGKDYHPSGEVCSLLVADEWETTGYKVGFDPAPADFLFLCESVAIIR